jgi:peptidoglycan/LPS O-acetylase OafA/YrhL
MNAHRFVVLDGLRGIAALIVLGFHLVQQHDLKALPLAVLAVDFFYVLSGFVVAFAYEQRLMSGAMSLTTFARVRITRLYPLVLLGTTAGIALGLSAAIAGRITYSELMAAGALGLLLLPSYVFPQWATAYPFNTAAWSLTFEFFANAVYGAIAPRLTSRRLVGLTVCAGAALLWVAHANHGIGGGNNQANFAYGFGRVMFPFFIGVLLYRFRLPRHVAPAVGLGTMLVLAALLLAPFRDAGIASVIYVLLAFPAIVAVGAAADVGPKTADACRWMGMLSYPVYMLQGPILRAGEELLKHWHPGPAGALGVGTVQAGLVIGVAAAALRFYDEPLQRHFRHLRRTGGGAAAEMGT